MPKKKTNEDFLTDLIEVNPTIIPLESYVNSKTKIKFECQICGEHWFAMPSKVLFGTGCPRCATSKNANNRKFSTTEFKEKLSAQNPSIELVGAYVNSQTKVTVHCKDCDNIWDVVPASLLHGTGCPKCHKRYRRNTDDFKAELSDISPHIFVLGEYKNAHSKLLVRCLRCGTEWCAEANSLLKGGDCPNCNHSQTSVVEQIICSAFQLLLGKESVISRDRKTIGKELDIYIPDLQLAIEFGAWYWHSKRIENDFEKEALCAKEKIRLVSIYEGCPSSTPADKMKGAVCFTQILSSEKGFTTIKDFITNLCKEYKIDYTFLDNNWIQIIKNAQENSRKKDAESFAEELSKSNENIAYVSGYTGSKNRVKVRCTICGHIWNASSAYDVLNGHGCPICANKKRCLSQRSSKDEFVAKVTSINPHIQLLEDYCGSSTSIKCLCKICGTVWSTKPSGLVYKKRNCPKCSPVTKLTDDEFIERLSVISNTINPKEKYINLRTKILFSCIECGYEWMASPREILNGTGCPQCSQRLPITDDIFIKRVAAVNEHVDIIDKYVNTKTKIKCKCKKCGYEWSAIPSNLMKGAGCQRCAGTLPYTNETFIEKLKKVTQSIEVLGEYVNLSTKILCRCKVCGHTWYPTPGNLLHGHGCPNCKSVKTRLLKSKKVICIETGIIYNSIQDAKNDTGITSISDCLHGRIKKAGGYCWKYL